MKPRLHIRQALSDPHLLDRSLEGDSWLPWRVLLIAAMGEKLTDDERVIFKQSPPRVDEYLTHTEGEVTEGETL
jgi:hypothetical protein